MQAEIAALNTASAQGKEAVITKAREIARTKIASTAYTTRNRTHREYVSDLYQVFWQRMPDPSGWDYWTRQVMLRGRENVLERMADSIAFAEVAGTLYRETLWLISDQLGTPRMIVERTGSLSGIKRHDYLPFGEELSAGGGGRTTSQGYSQLDGVRQRFAGSERDDETGLDFMQARYYASMQGRFSSPDPLLASGRAIRPQSWNRYAYVLNNPLRFIDPDGLAESDPNDQEKKKQEQQQQQKPAGLQVVSVTVLPTDQSNGIKVAVKYQVVDKDGKPIQRNDMVPQETVSEGTLNTPERDAQNKEAKVSGVKEPTDIGPSEKVEGTSRTTDEKGQFVDAPYGMTGPGPFTYTFEQKITILIGDERYHVRTNKVTVTSTGTGQGTITNGSKKKPGDINATRP